MSLSIAILSGFAAYNIGKENWTGVWITFGVMIFLVLATWIGANILIDWMEKKKRRGSN